MPLGAPPHLLKEDHWRKGLSHGFRDLLPFVVSDDRTEASGKCQGWEHSFKGKGKEFKHTYAWAALV